MEAKMEREGSIYNIEFKQSREQRPVSPDDLEKSVKQFLELYGEEWVVGKKFAKIIGSGDGETRLSRLLTAAQHENDARGFFTGILAQLEYLNHTTPSDISVNGLRLPYQLLLVILEQVIPGDPIFTVKSVRRLEKLTNIKIPKSEQATMQRVLDLYPVRLSNHTIRQIRLSPSVAYQYMPFADELDKEGLVHTWVGQFHRGVIEQMYRNRVIFILNMGCPVYCRFCFRKHKECRNQRAPTKKHVNLAIQYIKSSPDIKEVVLTGGDPFMNRATLTRSIDGLKEVPHVETLRVASRAVSYFPYLFTSHDGFWLNFLKRKQLELKQKNKRLEVATHFVHPDEVSMQSLDLISELVNGGIQVYVQTPFLGGCNDSGSELVELFKRLRAVGAEMHYVFMPCSPLQGNRKYRSPISSGLEAAAYLRAHLSDRAIPHFTTATAVGKIDWGSSGWVVEADPVDKRYLWVRTPYTQEYFASFAPLLNLVQVARLNSEGTLDAKFMANVGDLNWAMGSRDSAGHTHWYREREGFPGSVVSDALPGLQFHLRADQGGPPPIVPSDSEFLHRVHKTRVELNCDTSSEEIGRCIDLAAKDERITDVVLYSQKDALRSLYGVGKIVEKMAEISHITAVRIRSLSLNYEPEIFSDALIKRLASWNKLCPAAPTRLEIETRFLHSTEFKSEHEKIVKALRQRGVTVYNNTPLLGLVNDNQEEMARLMSGFRRMGMEMTNLYVAGMPHQETWNKEHPIHVSQVIDLASHLRITGSGRELPRYVVHTLLGDADFGLNALTVGSREDGTAVLKLLSYDKDYFTALAPGFDWPDGVETDDDGHPVLAVEGLLL
jgi:lysine 2,3-aminomutase